VSPYAPGGTTISFGPGGLTPAVRAIIYSNVAIFVLTLFAPGAFVGAFGLIPQAVVERGQIWRIATYLFLHDPNGFGHILFNMLFVWMFGVDLERRWGTVAFVKYYLITGIGAGLTVLAVSLLPLASVQSSYVFPTIGASGAIYGVLLAWALVFPHRQVLFMLVIPLPARVFAAIMGAIAFLSAVGASSSTVSHVAHLGGLVVGWLYLKGPTNLRGELSYRLTKWRMDRMRRRFDVRRGGRDDDWRNRIH
jgi:membrane associated rhomboid family serine protease